MKVYVYWIHLFDHTDPYTQGYVGISTQPLKRLKYHSNSKNKDNHILYENIKKGAIQTILHEYDCRKKALIVEHKYRPIEKIGWNIIPGGTDPPSRKGIRGIVGGMTGKKHRKESNYLRSVTISKLKWWNNEIVQIRSEICPEGFISGRLPHKKKYVIKKKNHMIGKSGKRISTPYGTFETITEASKKLNISWDKVSYRIKSKKYIEWFFI